MHIGTGLPKFLICGACCALALSVKSALTEATVATKRRAIPAKARRTFCFSWFFMCEVPCFLCSLRVFALCLFFVPTCLSSVALSIRHAYRDRASKILDLWCALHTCTSSHIRSDRGNSGDEEKGNPGEGKANILFQLAFHV